MLNALFVGMAILRVLSDMSFAGNVFLFLLTQIIYIPTPGNYEFAFRLERSYSRCG
jgi:hypothetical protein